LIGRLREAATVNGHWITYNGGSNIIHIYIYIYFF
jgi:hypothetical protein